jgi:serine/threonine-protein kinase RsbW
MFRKVIKEECKVPADIKYLGEMRNFVTHVGRKYGIPERILNAFKLAIDEAGTNIIRHAYRDWDGFVTLRMLIRNKDVTVSLIDQGHTFDLRRVRDPDLQRYVDIGKKGGLGIFIIRRVVDAIDYRKTVEGNELKLIKNRPHFSRRHLRLVPGRRAVE